MNDMNQDAFEHIQEELRGFDHPITLIVVTKEQDAEEIQHAIEAGAMAIAENRIEEAEEKLIDPLPVERHFIGNIQSRKIQRIVALFDVIQSVSSIEHLKNIDAACGQLEKPIRVLLQFNTTDTDRQGFTTSDIPSIQKILKEINNAQVTGIMGMATHGADEAQLRKEFAALREIRDTLHATTPTIVELSMGMSDDYQIAAQEGATMVRIGRALFQQAHTS